MKIKKLRTWVGRIKILNMYHVSLMVLPNSSYSQRVTARTQKFGEPHRYTRSSSRAWLVRPWPSPDRCGVQVYHMANLVTGVRRRVVVKVQNWFSECIWTKWRWEMRFTKCLFLLKRQKKGPSLRNSYMNYVWLWLLTAFRVLSKIGLQFLLSVLQVAWERETTRGIKSVLQVTGK